jgi:hypothetical protein
MCLIVENYGSQNEGDDNSVDSVCCNPNTKETNELTSTFFLPNH